MTIYLLILILSELYNIEYFIWQLKMVIFLSVKYFLNALLSLLSYD